MRQCVFVIGTRAQLVKVAPVLTRAGESGLGHVVWLTGQHEESMDDLIDDLGIPSTFVRPVRRRERSSIVRLASWIPGTLVACTRYLRGARKQTGAAPVVVVHGDTLSTWLGALAGRLAGGIVVHLESGLSSGSLWDPFPEELLRRVTFRLTSVALCPNDEACERMSRVGGCEVVHTAENTLLDCVRLVTASHPDALRPVAGEYFVASLHRFQNIYHRGTLTAIVGELIDLSGLSPVHFVLHPATEMRLRRCGLYDRLEQAPGVRLRPRLPYTEFLALCAGARGVISDGGSNQEELSYLGIPTVLLRKRSERPDGLGGNVVLRREIAMPLVEYARSGGLDALRRPSRVEAAAQPSRIAVDALAALVTSTAASR